VVAHQLNSRSSSESDQSRSRDVTGQDSPVAVAILSTDPLLRRSLEQLARDHPSVIVVGMVGRSADLVRLVGEEKVDIVLLDAPTREQLQEWRDSRNLETLLVLLDATAPVGAVDALNAGARAILDRSAGRAEIFATMMAARNELVVLQLGLLAELLDDTRDGALAANGFARVPLTRANSKCLPRWRTVHRTRRSPVGWAFRSIRRSFTSPRYSRSLTLRPEPKRS
jgi:DNA-binding NarL/FixJ family response regulator